MVAWFVVLHVSRYPTSSGRESTASASLYLWDPVRLPVQTPRQLYPTLACRNRRGPNRNAHLYTEDSILVHGGKVQPLEERNHRYRNRLPLCITSLPRPELVEIQPRDWFRHHLRPIVPGNSQSSVALFLRSSASVLIRVRSRQCRLLKKRQKVELLTLTNWY